MTTKRQIKKAAKMWGLAQVWHSVGSAATEETNGVIEEAGKWAERELGKMGYHPAMITSVYDCLKLVAT